MKYRYIGETELNVSEVAFGVWTVSTGWWGRIDRPDAIRLLQEAHEAGITLFDTADTYGLGAGEEVLRDALGKKRHELVIATKFGYDWYAHQERTRHKERPQRWDAEFIRYVGAERVPGELANRNAPVSCETPSRLESLGQRRVLVCC